MLYHTWYARSYGNNEKHTKRIDDVFSLLQFHTGLNSKPIVYKDYLFHLKRKLYKLRKAKASRNRYFLLARNLGYGDYIRVRSFPMLNLGAYKGGLIVEQNTKREHPMGGIAQRTIGYERFDEKGNVTRPGIDGAFGVKYLRGTDGQRRKQQIGKGQWKPLNDANEIDPKNGYDVYTTIDVNIQDIAHHALLEQLEKYKDRKLKIGSLKCSLLFFIVNNSY